MEIKNGKNDHEGSAKKNVTKIMDQVRSWRRNVNECIVNKAALPCVRQERAAGTMGGRDLVYLPPKGARSAGSPRKPHISPKSAPPQ